MASRRSVTGEFACFSDAQRFELAKTVVQATKGRVPVASVASTSIADAVRQTEAMVNFGADGILAIMEDYLPFSGEGGELLLRDRRGGRGASVVLYIHPNFQRSDLPLHVIEKLSRVQEYNLHQGCLV